MASLAIVWRNPRLVAKQRRVRQLEKNEIRTVYVVEELSKARTNGWQLAAALEVFSRPVPAKRPKVPERKWRFGLGR
jgi:hypothetical protein